MVRFLHTGDWQLGITRRFLTAEAQARFGGARLEALRAIGRLAVERQAAFVVVAGDVFESNHLDRQVLVQALGILGELDVDVYLLPGNHDPLDPATIYRSRSFVQHQPANVHLLTTSEPIVVGDGVELLGAPWTSKRPLEDLVGAACRDVTGGAGTTRVVVGHGAVDHGAPDPDDPALIELGPLQAAVRDGCIQYVALGDRHSLTQVGDSGRIWYAGTPEPTDFDEADPGKVLVVDCDIDDCRVEAVPVGTWRFVRERVELEGDDDLGRLEAWLQDLTAKERTIVRLSVVGSLPLRDAARLDRILEDAAVAFASAEIWEPDSDLIALPDELDLADLDLAGFAHDTARDLRGAAGGAGLEAAQARSALTLLYRLSQDRDG